MSEEFIGGIEMKRLLLVAELPIQRVHEEICPECSFKTSYCEWRIKLTLADPRLVFVCRGMRAWVDKQN